MFFWARVAWLGEVRLVSIASRCHAPIPLRLLLGLLELSRFVERYNGCTGVWNRNMMSGGGGE